MTPDTLARIGASLYGTRWKTDIANDLGVTYRTIQRWCGGDMPPDAKIITALTPILEKRGADIAEILADINP